MKKVVIVHGWDFNPSMHWYPLLKKELEKKGCECIVPKMPNTAEPKIEKWVSHLEKTAGMIDNETIFIGHSIGCQTIMRYLQTLPGQTKVRKVTFVSGWFKLSNLEDESVAQIARPWLETPINFKKVKQKISMLTVFLSDNDSYNCVQENAQIFKEQLGANVIIEKNKGHFTTEDGVMQMPEVLKEILS